jgi:hypothetical protein
MRKSRSAIAAFLSFFGVSFLCEPLDRMQNGPRLCSTLLTAFGCIVSGLARGLSVTNQPPASFNARTGKSRADDKDPFRFISGLSLTA